MKENIDVLPGKKSLPIIGEFLKISKQGIKYFEEGKKKYGEIYKFRMPKGMAVGFFSDTATIDILKNYGDKINLGNAAKELLGPVYPNSIMTMDGPEHKRDRSILMQAFQKTSLVNYIKKLPIYIEHLIDGLDGKKTVKVHPTFKTFNLRIVGRLFFGIEDDIFIKKVNKSITPMSAAMVNVPVNLPGTTYYKGLKGRKFMSREFLKLVPEKRAKPGSDFFSTLCNASNEDGDTLPDESIVDHLLFLYQAAFDTTSWTLSYFTYCLAKYPEWQEKMRQEVRTIDLTTIDLTTILGLEISTQVFNEVMRMAPAVPLTTREASEDLKINKEVTVPKGTKIWVSMEMSMKDTKYWSNPQEFNPARFGEELKEHKNCPYAFLPFGAGPHQCIGRVFAEIVIKMTMIGLLQKFKFSVSEKYKIPILEFPIMKPKDGLPIHFEKIT